MRIIPLSDHPGAMLQAVQEKQRKAEEQVRSYYEKRLAEHRARVEEARRRRDEARAQRRWWSWIRGVSAVWNEQRLAPRPPVIYHRTSDQEEVLAAGMAGERTVEQRLGSVLDDDWVLFCGYRNRGGEIDRLLLGPGGPFGMEVKHRNATVHIDGDDWWYDKYDRFGNLVEQGKRMTDRGGRSPSMQINDSADGLEEFLRSRRQHFRIERIVLLTHPRSQLGSYRNLTVTVATTMDYVIGLLGGSLLQPGQRAELERLIMQDHRFHDARTPRARMDGGR